MPKQQQAIPPPITLDHDDVAWLEIGRALRMHDRRLYSSARRLLDDIVRGGWRQDGGASAASVTGDKE